MARSDRSYTDAHRGLRAARGHRRKAIPVPRWSLPLPRVLRWMAAAVAVSYLVALIR
jgi:hypothetical protein